MRAAATIEGDRTPKRTRTRSLTSPVVGARGLRTHQRNPLRCAPRRSASASPATTAPTLGPHRLAGRLLSPESTIYHYALGRARPCFRSSSRTSRGRADLGRAFEALETSLPLPTPSVHLVPSVVACTSLRRLFSLLAHPRAFEAGSRSDSLAGGRSGLDPPTAVGRPLNARSS